MHQRNTNYRIKILQTTICQQFGNLEEMDIFLETYNHPKLNDEESENLNRQITSSKIEAVIKKISKQTKVTGWMDSQVNFTKYSRRTINCLSQIIPKKSRKEKTPSLLYKASIILTLKSNKQHKLKNYRQYA